MEEQDRAIEADLEALLARFATSVAEAKGRGMPTLYLGHTGIRDALMAGGERQLPPGHEIELAVGHLINLGCDYSGCGHVHLRQELGAGYGIYIVGSPDRSNFGEETDVKGWNVVDIVSGLPARVHRRQSPTRLFRTFQATWTCDAAGLWDWRFAEPVDFAALTGAEVRVRMIIPEEALGSYAGLALERLFRDAHVYAFHPERRVVPKQDVRCPEIVQTESLAEQLRLFWLSEGAAGPEADQVARCLVKLADLEVELAEAA